MKTPLTIARPTRATVGRWLAVPLALGVATYCAAHAARAFGPVISIPDRIDLGLRNDAEQVMVPVAITNAGYRTLELAEVQSSCPCCVELGRDTPQGFEYLNGASIPAGEVLRAVARIHTHGDANRPFRGAVWFRTNDSACPTAEIAFSATVQGQIVALPTELNLGTVEPSKSVATRVAIRNLGRLASCTIDRVESSNPKCLRVEAINRGSSDGPGVAEILVQVEPADGPWKLAGELVVYETNRRQPLLTVPVRAEVAPAVEVRPSSLVLPHVAGVRRLDSAEVVVRSTGGRPIQVAFDGAPSGIRVERVGKPPSDSEVRLLVILGETRAAVARTERVRLQVACYGRTHLVELPVTIRGPE